MKTQQGRGGCVEHSYRHWPLAVCVCVCGHYITHGWRERGRERGGREEGRGEGGREGGRKGGREEGRGEERGGREEREEREGGREEAPYPISIEIGTLQDGQHVAKDIPLQCLVA